VWEYCSTELDVKVSSIEIAKARERRAQSVAKKIQDAPKKP
jgi:phage regulator Rha-like protein